MTDLKNKIILLTVAAGGFGMALSRELSGTGISVTNVYPFWADTDILNSPSYGARRTTKLWPVIGSQPVQ